MSKNTFIDRVRVGGPCTEDWNQMHGNDQVRMCSHCVKEVNNMSALTRKEAKRLVRRSDNDICIRYIQHPVTKRPLFADQMYQITRRAPGIAAGVMTASLSISTAAYAQSGSVSTADVVDRVAATDAGTKDVKSDERSISQGTVEGDVVDSAGAVVAGASVTITDGKFASSATTNADGHFSVSSVPGGTYSVQIASPGFKESIINGVAVGSDETQSVRATLEVGDEMIAIAGGIGFSRDYSTPLMRAVDNDDIEQVRELIVNGENVNGRDEEYDKFTPLFLAVENGNIEMVQLLLDSGAKVNVRSTEKVTPLMLLDRDATPELVDLLVRYGAKLNVSDNDGNTALINAAESAPTDVLRALIAAGADVSLANKEGVTALMKAAEQGEIENVRLLLESGANADARDKEGDNASEYTEDKDIEAMLVAYGAKAKVTEPKADNLQ